MAAPLQLFRMPGPAEIDSLCLAFALHWPCICPADMSVDSVPGEGEEWTAHHTAESINVAIKLALSLDGFADSI